MPYTDPIGIVYLLKFSHSFLRNDIFLEGYHFPTLIDKIISRVKEVLKSVWRYVILPLLWFMFLVCILLVLLRNNKFINMPKCVFFDQNCINILTFQQPNNMIFPKQTLWIRLGSFGIPFFPLAESICIKRSRFNLQISWVKSPHKHFHYWSKWIRNIPHHLGVGLLGDDESFGLWTCTAPWVNSDVVMKFEASPNRVVSNWNLTCLEKLEVSRSLRDSYMFQIVGPCKFWEGNPRRFVVVPLRKDYFCWSFWKISQTRTDFGILLVGRCRKSGHFEGKGVSDSNLQSLTSWWKLYRNLENHHLWLKPEVHII